MELNPTSGTISDSCTSGSIESLLSLLLLLFLLTAGRLSAQSFQGLRVDGGNILCAFSSVFSKHNASIISKEMDIIHTKPYLLISPHFLYVSISKNEVLATTRQRR